MLRSHAPRARGRKRACAFDPPRIAGRRRRRRRRRRSLFVVSGYYRGTQGARC